MVYKAIIILILNSKPISTIDTNDILSDAMNDLSKHQNQIRFFKLSGSKHSDNVPTSNYKWGTAIVITRDSSSITVLLFPETTGTPVINYWLRISDSWTGWKNFTTT